MYNAKKPNRAYLCAMLKRKEKLALKTEEKYPLICITLYKKSPCILYVIKISRAIFNKRCLRDSVF